MIWLKQSTSVVISFGPFLDPSDGKTLVTSLVSAIDHASTGIFLSKNGGTLTIRHASVTASTYDAYGNYKVTLDTTDTNTLGTLRMQFAASATNLPVWADFMVVPANVWDSMFGASKLLVSVNDLAAGSITRSVFSADSALQSIRSNTAQAGAASTITLDASASSVDSFYKGTIIYLTGGTGVGQARLITGYVGSTKVATVSAAWVTNPDNTSTFAIESVGAADLQSILGVVVSTSTAQLGVNVVNNAGSAITAAAGVQEVKVQSIAANAITATSIAADAITDAKVASDVTIASVTGAVGSVTGAVGSVTGAVGSVTGNVGGNVVGSVASIASGGITAASFAADSITSSALAASAVSEIQSGITPLDAAGTRAALGMASANLDTQLAAIAALIPSANTNADALLDRGDAIETSYTVRQALRLVLSVLAGPSSGLDGTTATYRDVNDSKNRVIATIDADGNRSGMTYDVT